MIAKHKCAGRPSAYMQGVSSLYARAVPARYRAQLARERCDAHSACGRGAAALLQLLERDAHMEQSSAALRSWCRCGLMAATYERLIAELDHEQLLSEHGCSALAVLTVHEALRTCAGARVISNDYIAALERVELHLREFYNVEPQTQAARDKARLLRPKHLGHGVEYLRLLQRGA